MVHWNIHTNGGVWTTGVYGHGVPGGLSASPLPLQSRADDSDEDMFFGHAHYHNNDDMMHQFSDESDRVAHEWADGVIGR
mmetsp:Transcript_37787/g.108009  ORF Transcript_37787/g.108009 Transcript_37787/m.108009 type:complete len:80 (+) Transcript_37787:3-242(+)